MPKPFALGLFLTTALLASDDFAARSLNAPSGWNGSISCEPCGRFFAGFRVEHPQAFIDSVQYGERDAMKVQRGRGRIPVADYRLAASVGSAATVSPALSSWGEAPDSLRSAEQLDGACTAAAPAERSVFSFCMCPGGAVAREKGILHSQRCPAFSCPQPCNTISWAHQCLSRRANRADQHFRGRALCQRNVLQVSRSVAPLSPGASADASSTDPDGRVLAAGATRSGRTPRWSWPWAPPTGSPGLRHMVRWQGSRCRWRLKGAPRAAPPQTPTKGMQSACM